MIRLTKQAVTSVAIAVVTTIATTAFTSYLLERPWCIQIQADDHQRIVYGSQNCAAAKGSWRPRRTAHREIPDWESTPN